MVFFGILDGKAGAAQPPRAPDGAARCVRVESCLRWRRAASTRCAAAQRGGARGGREAHVYGYASAAPLLPALLRPRLTLTGSATQVAGACVVFVRRRVATRCP